MSSQQIQNGTILWYRPTAAQGVVKADSGRQFFILGGEALGPAPGLRVSFRVVVPDGGGPPQLTDLALLGGSRQIVTPQAPPPVQAPRKKAAAGPKKVRTGPAPPAPARSKARPGAALADGTPVNHPVWGSGHVVGSTSHFVSIEFLQGGRRNVSADELQNVSGHRGKPAPSPQKRRAGFNDRVAKSPASRVVRRDRSGDEEAPEREAGAWNDMDPVDE